MCDFVFSLGVCELLSFILGQVSRTSLCSIYYMSPILRELWLNRNLDFDKISDNGPVFHADDGGDPDDDGC